MDPRPKLYPDLALCGRMRAGKDSIATYLIKDFGYKKLSFAHELKEEVSRAADCTVEEMEHEPLRSQIRPVLQAWGTEFRRSQNVDYWVKKLEERIVDERQIAGDGLVAPSVVTDVRFPNEIQMLQYYGFTVVHVDMDYDDVVDYLMAQGKSENAARDLLDHPSEKEWQKANFDVVVESNMGDLPYLFKQIEDAIINASVFT